MDLHAVCSANTDSEAIYDCQCRYVDKMDSEGYGFHRVTLVTAIVACFSRLSHSQITSRT